MIYRGRISRIVDNDVYVQISSLAVDQDFGPMEMIDSSGFNINDYVLVTQIDGAAEDLVIIGVLRETIEAVITGIPIPTQNDSFLGGAAAGTISWKTTAQTKTTLGISALETEVQPVNRGGTGKTSYTTGNYIQATGTTTLSERTPTQVRSDLGLTNAITADPATLPISTATQAALDLKTDKEGTGAVTGMDFNTLFLPQTIAFGIANAAASTNIPEPVRGVLNVRSAAGYVVQNYHTIDTNRMWTRTYIVATGAWLNWVNVVSAPQEIGNAADLDTFAITGLYVQTQNAEAATGTNYPIPSAGMLEVVQNFVNGTDHVWQKYTCYNGSTYANQEFARARYAGVWGPWKYTGGGIAPYAAFHKVTSLTAVSGTTYTVDFDGQDTLEGGITEASGVYTIPLAGKYNINCGMHLQSTATTGGYFLHILKNGSIFRQLNYDPPGANASFTIQSTMKLGVGDTIAIRFSQSTGANVVLYGVAPGVRYSYLDIAYTGS